MDRVIALNRTLEQELLALARGVSLECLACGEFVLHTADGSIECPQCRSRLDLGVVQVLALDGHAG